LKEKGVPSKDLVMIKLVQINMVICRLCPEKKENQENQVHVNTILSILDEKVNISSSISVKAFSESYFEYSGGIYIQPINVGFIHRVRQRCDGFAMSLSTSLSHRSDNARHR
jgi:hypothetical protein